MYSTAFLRFWWVLLLGVVAGVVAAGAVVKHHKATTYSASSQLLVDSAQHPFLRSALGAGASAPTSKSSSAKSASGAGLLSPSGDAQVLVNAANFYPMLIQSDVVKTYREKHFGVIPGTVKAKAIGATQGINRYVPSIFPIIEIDTTAPSAADAVNLASVAAKSFEQWLTQQQVGKEIPDRQRISVLPIVTPTGASAQNHHHYSLAIIAGCAAFALFLGLAVMLDRLVPVRNRELLEEPHPEPSGPPRIEVSHRIGNYT
jgi:hypothetical protein